MKYNTEIVKICFDVEIHYNSDKARQAAIKEACDYYKRVSSSEGYWIDANHMKGEVIE